MPAMPGSPVPSTPGGPRGPIGPGCPLSPGSPGSPKSPLIPGVPGKPSKPGFPRPEGPGGPAGPGSPPFPRGLAIRASPRHSLPLLHARLAGQVLLWAQVLPGIQGALDPRLALVFHSQRAQQAQAIPVALASPAVLGLLVGQSPLLALASPSCQPCPEVPEDQVCQYQKSQGAQQVQVAHEVLVSQCLVSQDSLAVQVVLLGPAFPVHQMSDPMVNLDSIILDEKFN
ncbi:hypothetical protein E2320_000337 [Naja naja]|nr:hypothetical protein E2320_000337 [Naja naja]